MPVKRRLVDEEGLKVLPVRSHVLDHVRPDLGVARVLAVELVGEGAEEAVAVAGDHAQGEAEREELRHEGLEFLVVLFVAAVLLLSVPPPLLGLVLLGLGPAPVSSPVATPALCHGWHVRVTSDFFYAVSRLNN